MSEARITWISGPVLRARTTGPFQLREAIEVGEARLLGEVTRVGRDEIVAQVYEDSTGLRPGDRVAGSGALLAVTLGPGLLGGIYDGLLRPLGGGRDPYFAPGLRAPEARRFAFEPLAAVGDELAPGAAFSRVHGHGGPEQICLVPPESSGRVLRVATPGEYAEDDAVLELERDGAHFELGMRQRWPVRRPRPVAAHLPGEAPLVTGQRVIDSLFPLALGGRAAIPGGFGTGKTILLETIAKWCSADVIVYVGCGERGNEIAGVLEEFPRLVDPRSGRSLLERTVIIANASNMPVSAREASVFTAVTVAEYFRDQGLHVALMADSTSRWAEAMREVAARLGELPAEGGYPAQLASQLAEFYERGGRARALCGREGSVALIGAVSPPSGDLSEPVTSQTKRHVRCYWALDARRAQARFYPALDPLGSYSEDAERLAQYWSALGNARYDELRRAFLVLVEEQAKLERMARILGKDALPARSQLALLCAELVSEGFLRQSAFHPVDRYCSPARQSAMMRVIGRYIELATQAVAAGAAPEALRAMPEYRRLLRMKEEIGEDAPGRFTELERALESAFGRIEAPHAA
jgi:V/A-type H+-transporting ATPase subunit A